MYRLIYKSESTVPMNWRTVGSILDASTRHNDRNGLSGVLLIGKRHFLQILEGDSAAVNGTFQRISRDQRHRNIKLIALDSVENRLFAEWDMRGVGVFEFDPPISAALIEKYGEENGALRFPEEESQALALTQDIFKLHALPEWKVDESA
jgi:hypothetical protein